MKYVISCGFLDYNTPVTFNAKDAKDRDRIIKKLREDYYITYLEYSKLLKDGTKIPCKLEVE